MANALTAITMQNPYDQTVECAQFTVDDPSDLFVLSKICMIDQDYTFTLWAKSEAEGSIITCNKNLAITTDWSKHVVTFTADSTSLTLGFTTPGTYYIYHPQLEVGTMSTDWTPAPEDTDDDLSNIRIEMTEQRTEILETSEGVFMSALKNYVSADEYATFKSEMNIRADGIEMEFAEQLAITNDNVADLSDEAHSEFEERKKFIDYGMNGITLSSGNHTKTLQLDNEDGIVFKKNDLVVGIWDGENFYTGNIVIRTTERAQFGDFGFVPRSDGSLCFLKIADSGTAFTTLMDGVLTLHNIKSTIDDHVLTFDGVTTSIGLDGNGNNTLTIGG